VQKEQAKGDAGTKGGVEGFRNGEGRGIWEKTCEYGRKERDWVETWEGRLKEPDGSLISDKAGELSKQEGEDSDDEISEQTAWKLVGRKSVERP